MKLKTISIFPLLLVLTACAALGVPPADTFNKKAAAATVSVNTASQTVLTLLQARKISPDESDSYTNRAEEAQSSIDLARFLWRTDPTGAQDKLDLAITALQVLITELEKRK